MSSDTTTGSGSAENGQVPGEAGGPGEFAGAASSPRLVVTNRTFDDFDWADPDVDLEELSARLHDIYQLEAHRRGDVRHADAYADLSEGTKEWDRVLARWILKFWTLRFPDGGLPDAE